MLLGPPLVCGLLGESVFQALQEFPGQRYEFRQKIDGHGGNARVAKTGYGGRSFGCGIGHGNEGF
jgi:hypothetical protein